VKLLRDCKNFYVGDWKNNRLLFFLENTGTLLSLISASLIALMNQDAPFLLVFSIFLLANILLILAGYLRNSSPLIFLNIGFTLINIIGLVGIIGVR